MIDFNHQYVSCNFPAKSWKKDSTGGIYGGKPSENHSVKAWQIVFFCKGDYKR